jgi:hypothetical protein
VALGERADLSLVPPADERTEPPRERRLEDQPAGVAGRTVEEDGIRPHGTFLW